MQLPKHFVAHKDGNILLTAAERLGWQVDVTHGKEANLAKISKNGRTYQVLRGIISVDDSVAISIATDKYLTNMVLKDATAFITHPQMFDCETVSDQEISSILNKYPKVVVKPVDENEGVGITTSLTTVSGVKSAIQKVIGLGIKKILIENHVETVNEYRIMLWKGEVFDILKRIPAYVVGNGKSTIKELIEEKNYEREHQYDNIFAPIKSDEDCLNFLAKNSLSMGTVLEFERRLTLESTCNLAQGGETERISLDMVHEEYFKLFRQVYKATRLNHCGVDLISPDLTNPPRDGSTAINEINSAPACTVAYFADLKNDTPFYGAEKFLRLVENDPPDFNLALTLDHFYAPPHSSRPPHPNQPYLES